MCFHNDLISCFRLLSTEKGGLQWPSNLGLSMISMIVWFSSSTKCLPTKIFAVSYALLMFNDFFFFFCHNLFTLSSTKSYSKRDTNRIGVGFVVSKKVLCSPDSVRGKMLTSLFRRKTGTKTYFSRLSSFFLHVASITWLLNDYFERTRDDYARGNCFLSFLSMKVWFTNLCH